MLTPPMYVASEADIRKLFEQSPLPELLHCSCIYYMSVLRC